MLVTGGIKIINRNNRDKLNFGVPGSQKYTSKIHYFRTCLHILLNMSKTVRKSAKMDGDFLKLHSLKFTIKVYYGNFPNFNFNLKYLGLNKIFSLTHIAHACMSGILFSGFY